MRLPDLRQWMTKRRGPQLTREEALSARPVPNPALTWEDQDNGKVLLTVPLELKPWMKLARLLTPVPAQKQVELDEVGSDVWRWLDGEATVGDLAGRLADEHKLNRREAEVSITQFLQMLGKRRFIGFALDLDEVDEDRAKVLRKTLGGAPGVQAANAAQPDSGG